MNILILGSGGREHTFAWKMAQSPKCGKLFVAPGNAGTNDIATNLTISPTDFKEIEKAIIQYSINLLVVGPEDPLVKGIVNYFRANNEFDSLIIIGPDQAGAQLEGSKDFSKSFMNKYGIPTARSITFNAHEYDKAIECIEHHSYPLVLKADGLAAGKGVIIAQNFDEAELALQDILINKKFKEAGNKVLIEDFLDGIELSVFVLSDGKNYQILPEAKDYKRIGENDTGLNTGGMGAVSPVPFANAEFLNKVEEQVIKRTIAGLGKEGIDFKGFLFIGLMNINNEPFVIEYNVRMGDPETQVVLPRIESDLVELFEATGNQTLDNYTIKISKQVAAAVVAVAAGYPGNYEKGKLISGIGIKDSSTMVFQAGTKNGEGQIRTNGGRVLAVTAMANSIVEAKNLAYHRLEKINWPGMYFRKDISDDLLT